jgi:hypothetical protein
MLIVLNLTLGELTVYQTQWLDDMNGAIRSVDWRSPVDCFIMVNLTTCDEMMLSRYIRDSM